MTPPNKAELIESVRSWFDDDNLAYKNEADIKAYIEYLKKSLDPTAEEMRVIESEIFRLHNDLKPTPYDLREAATALYAGGWKAADRDMISSDYGVTREGVMDAICEHLAEIEKKEKEKGAGE